MGKHRSSRKHLLGMKAQLNELIPRQLDTFKLTESALMGFSEMLEGDHEFDETTALMELTKLKQAQYEAFNMAAISNAMLNIVRYLLNETPHNEEDGLGAIELTFSTDEVK